MDDGIFALIVDASAQWLPFLFRTEKLQQAMSLDEGIIMAARLLPVWILLANRFDSPSRTGIDDLHFFREASPSSRILVWSNPWSRYEEELALSNGASAYVSSHEMTVMVASSGSSLANLEVRPRAPARRQRTPLSLARARALP
jgi:hypothetical protein